jgi:hypothetical protein
MNFGKQAAARRMKMMPVIPAEASECQHPARNSETIVGKLELPAAVSEEDSISSLSDAQRSRPIRTSGCDFIGPQVGSNKPT